MTTVQPYLSLSSLTIAVAIDDTFVQMHSCVLRHFVTFNKHMRSLFTRSQCRNEVEENHDFT